MRLRPVATRTIDSVQSLSGVFVHLGLEPCEELHASGLAQDAGSVSIGCCVNDLRTDRDSASLSVFTFTQRVDAST